MVYLVAYDLNSPGQNYQKVSVALETLSDRLCHFQKSVWLIRTDRTAQEVGEAIRAATDRNDEYLVIEVAGNYYGVSTKADGIRDVFT